MGWRVLVGVPVIALTRYDKEENLCKKRRKVYPRRMIAPELRARKKIPT